MIPGFTRRQKSDTMSFAATSISKKNSIFVVKRLEILNIQPRFAVSPFLRSNHFFVVAVAGQIPATTSTGMAPKHAWNKPYRGCKPPLSARNSKFQWWKIYYEENFKKYVSRNDRSTYVIQTLRDGSDVHARHGTTGDDAMADTQSHIYSRFVCTDTKLVDVVIFFPLISNVL